MKITDYTSYTTTNFAPRQDMPPLKEDPDVPGNRCSVNTEARAASKPGGEMKEPAPRTPGPGAARNLPIPNDRWKMATGVMVLSLALVLLFPFASTAQRFSRTITKSASFANPSDTGNTFRIMNINGSVTIEAYAGKTIELTVDEEIEGSGPEVEKGKKELEYKLERRGNLVLAYVDAPFITLTRDGDHINYCINREDGGYQFIHDVRVRIPQGIVVKASTINGGKVQVAGSFRQVDADNVNGDLKLENMTSKTDASTVNGDITISYKKAPTEDTKYQTVNGTIEVFLPPTLSADVYFKSMHGDLYTDFENLRRLKATVREEKESEHSTVTYRIDKFTPMRIGEGGPKLSFQVLNGDVYLRKQ